MCKNRQLSAPAANQFLGYKGNSDFKYIYASRINEDFLIVFSFSF